MSERKFTQEERELFNSIDEGLGVVTDFEITQNKKDLTFKYKSNGEEQTIVDSHVNGKMLIQCIVYCSKRFARK